jgi:hypothetical protein
MRRISTDLWIALVLLLLMQVACCDATRQNQATAGGQMAAAQRPQIDHDIRDTVVPTVEWTPELEQLRDNILGAGCDSPCLFGITPGVTAADDVPVILNELREEGILDFYLNNHPTGLDYIFLFPAGFGGGIIIREETNLVTDVGFGLSVQFLMLGDVIGAYGEPDLVAYGQGDSHEGLYFGYTEKQIFLWARTNTFGNQPVSFDMVVITMRYLSPSAVNHPLTSPDVTWVEWEGYLDIYDYYRKIRPEQYEPVN